MASFSAGRPRKKPTVDPLKIARWVGDERPVQTTRLRPANFFLLVSTIGITNVVHTSVVLIPFTVPVLNFLILSWAERATNKTGGAGSLQRSKARQPRHLPPRPCHCHRWVVRSFLARPAAMCDQIRDRRPVDPGRAAARSHKSNNHNTSTSTAIANQPPPTHHPP